MLATSVFVLVPLIIFMFLFQWMRNLIVERYSEESKQSVEAIGRAIDYNLMDVENLTNSILSNHELIDALKTGKVNEFQRNLNSYFTSSSNIDGIYTITSSGYHHVGMDIKDGIQSFPRKEVGNTSGEIIWVPTSKVAIRVLSGSVTKNYFFMGRKIIDVNSLEELGYMSVAIDESIIQESYIKLKEDRSGVVVVDKLGNVISALQEERDLLPSFEGDYVYKLLQNSGSGYHEFKRNGIAYVAIYADLNDGNWRIIKTIPKSVLYKDVNAIQFFTILITAILMAVIFLIAHFYSKKITSPISNMMVQMKEVEAGNLSVRLETNVDNELDDLSESFNHMVGQIETLMKEVVQAERDRNELELEVLHAQINPHFLYNTLNTIRWMAKIKNENSISNAIVALVKLLRVSISLGKKMITLKEEIEYIENYVLIQKLRFNQEFEIEYNIQEEYSGTYIPKLILQPIVENALIYGIDENDVAREHRLKIRIYTHKVGEDLYIVVEDNGPGIQEEVLLNIFQEERGLDKFSKVGLNNVNQRLKLYFGDAYGLEIKTKINVGTKVLIKVQNKQTLEVM